MGNEGHLDLIAGGLTVKTVSIVHGGFSLPSIHACPNPYKDLPVYPQGTARASYQEHDH